MRPSPGEVLHFSENPAIASFEPHVAATARQSEAYVWAVDAEQAPAYWFPRQCPRAMAWPVESTTDDDRLAVHDLGPWWRAVIASTVGFSGIRLRNAGTPL